MSSLSDPSRASRRDRRRAQKAIDAAYAAGRLTAADRALRTQRVEAAQTVGDLVMITRDIPEADTKSLGSAIDPALLESMRVKPTSTSGSPLGGGAQSIDLSAAVRKFKLIAIVVIVGMVSICGLGIVGMVFSAFSGSSGGGDTPTVSPTSGIEIRSTGEPKLKASSLHSAEGWRQLVAAIKEKSGTTEVYDAVVYPDYASVGMVWEKGVERQVFRDGAFLDSFKVRTSPATGNRVDLAQIDPSLVARLPRQTAERLGLNEASGAYLIINALPTDPRIMVYVQTDEGAQYRVYGLDGTPQN